MRDSTSLPGPAGQGMPIGAVRGARQVSSGARSRLACPQLPSPQPGMGGYAHRDGAWGPAGILRCPVSPCMSTVPPPQPGMGGYAHRDGVWGPAGILGCPVSPCMSTVPPPQPGRAGYAYRDGAWGPAGILGCPVSPCMSTSAPALRYPWLLAGDAVEVWV